MAAPTAPGAAVTAEQAWKLLSMVNEWIRFADAKAGATLAFSGVMGTLLYNLVKDLHQRTTWLDVTVVLTCTLLFLAVLLAGWTIAPRMKGKDVVPDTINNLYFASIAANYKGNRLAYREELGRLSTDSQALVEELADQIHVNATIATAKNQRVAWAVRAGLVAGLLLALVTIQVGLL
ncbi:Pycsar system effector family protein [Ornithinimicrobium sp. Y1694]|uniref:Pycsar system effector family protein n=1 Tax=Ornithinimicrobium sp. Y1694 TaxID=3418590 RepID=UPI003CE8DC66